MTLPGLLLFGTATVCRSALAQNDDTVVDSQSLGIGDREQSAGFENFSAFLGNTERTAMIYYLSLVREDKVRPLLNAEQWQILEPHLIGYLRFEAHLARQGLIASRPREVDVSHQ